MAPSFTLSESDFNALVQASDDFYKQKFNTSTSSFARVGTNDHVCSFLKAQNQKQFTGKLKTTMTYTPEYIAVRTFMKLITERPVTVFLKHHVCFFALVAQKLQTNDEKDKKSLYNEIKLLLNVNNGTFNNNIDFLDPQHKEAVKNIINCILDKKNNVTFLMHIQHMKSKDKPIFNIETTLLKNVFQDNIGLNTAYDIGKIHTKIQELIKAICGTETSIQNLFKFKKYHNPYQCTKLAFDVITMEQFSDLQFKDAYKFIHLGEYCFSVAALGPQIIIQKGQLRHGTVKIKLSEDDIEYMLNLLWFYRGKHIEDFDKDVKAQDSLYTDSDNVVGEFKNFFRAYLDGSNASEANYNNIEDIVMNSSNTLVDLIGLTGYILLGDNAIGHESAADFFELGAICIGELNRVYNELPDALKKSFNELEFDGVKIFEIINDSANSCIHGVGYRCVKFYLAAYEAIQFCKAKLHAKVVAEKAKQSLLPWQNQDHQELVLKLIDCFIELPSPSDTSTKYIKYLSCDRLDNTKESQMESLNCEYSVRGYTNHFAPIFIGYLKFNQFKNCYQGEPLTNLVLPSNRMGITLYFHKAEDHGMDAILISQVENQLDHLLKCQLVQRANSIHRNRSQLYRTFCNYTLDMVKLHHVGAEKGYNGRFIENESVFNEWKKHADKMKEQFFDVVNLEDCDRIPKFTMFDYKVDENKAFAKAAEEALAKAIEALVLAKAYEEEVETELKDDLNNHTNEDVVIQITRQELAKAKEEVSKAQNEVAEAKKEVAKAKVKEEDLAKIVDVIAIDAYLPNVVQQQYNAGGIVNDPLTNADMTKIFLKQQLIGRVIYNLEYDATFMNEMHMYAAFEDYALKAGGQSLNLVQMFFSDDKYSKILNYVNLTSFEADLNKKELKEKANLNNETLVEISKIYKLLQVLVYGYFLQTNPKPESTQFFRGINDIARLPNIIQGFQYNSQRITSDIIAGLCPSSKIPGNQMLHFTTLSQEAQLLMDLSKRLNISGKDAYQATNATYETIIEVLYAKGIIDTPLSDVRNKTLYWQDLQPFAKEYAVKIASHEMHAIEINQFKIAMEEALAKFKTTTGQHEEGDDLHPFHENNKKIIEHLNTCLQNEIMIKQIFSDKKITSNEDFEYNIESNKTLGDIHTDLKNILQFIADLEIREISRDMFFELDERDKNYKTYYDHAKLATIVQLHCTSYQNALCSKLLDKLNGMPDYPLFKSKYAQMKSETHAQIQLLTSALKRLELKTKTNSITAPTPKASSYDMKKIDKFLDEICQDPTKIIKYI